jgi:hypothetical protein
MYSLMYSTWFLVGFVTAFGSTGLDGNNWTCRRHGTTGRHHGTAGPREEQTDITADSQAFMDFEREQTDNHLGQPEYGQHTFDQQAQLRPGRQAGHQIASFNLYH